ncbi:MAG: hypothetical protein ACE5GH_03185 [Fidelibacterota bacterium]
MKYRCVLILFLMWFPIWGQDDMGTAPSAAESGSGEVTEGEDQSVSETDEALADTPGDSVPSDTLATAMAEEAQVDTMSEKLPEVPQTLDAGYKGFPWGADMGHLERYVKADSIAFMGDGEAATVPGVLGEDTVSLTYSFSDKGFWKVSVDYRSRDNSMEGYMDDFSRVEKFLSKRYGPPNRTTQNEMGTDREYLFSRFPKLSRAYFRSSWIVEAVRIELILEAVVPLPDEGLPVFDDLQPLFRLYYYHPEFYEKSEPTTTEIPEETLLDAY